MKGIEIEKKEEIKKGGTFVLTEYELEQMSNEYAEINNIIALAKADNGIKILLLSEILKEFSDELQQHFYDYFGSQGMIREV